MSTDSEETKKTQLDEIDVGLFRYIETSDLTWKKKGTFSDLINNSNQKESKIKITRNGRRYDFKEPIYIDIIEFLSTNDSSPEITFSYFDMDNNKVTVDESLEEKSKKWVDYRLHALVKGILIEPKNIKSGFLGKLAGVYITGFSLSELPERLKSLSENSYKLEDLFNETKGDLEKIEKEKQAIIEKTQKHKDYVESVEEKLSENKKTLADQIEELDNLENDLEAKRNALSKVDSSVAAQQSIYAELEKKKANIEDSIEQLNEERNILNKDIAKNTTKLKELKDDINSFSENISDYVRESNRQVRTYFGLTSVALLSLGFIGYELVIRINDLINFYEKLNIPKGAVKLLEGIAIGSVESSVKFPALDLLLLRAPMALIVSFFVYLFSKVVYSLIKKIIALQDEKKELIGASIIAKETVEASSKDLELSANDIYNLKEGLKLEFLQHTMFSGHIKTVKDSKERRRTLFNNLKLKLKNQTTGTDVEFDSNKEEGED